MTPDRVAALGMACLVIFQYVRSDDSVSAFAIGGFVGLVSGFVLGAAWLAGEPPSVTSPEADTINNRTNP